MCELLQDHDEGRPDEAAPVWVPGVVDYGWISWYAYGWLLGVDLVVAVPMCRSDRMCELSRRRILLPLSRDVVILATDDVSDYSCRLLFVVAFVSSE